MSRADEASGCRLWLGTKRNGYGRLTIGSKRAGTAKSVSAHRLAFALYCAPIPAGMEICHHCDIRACIEPTHLFCGTKHDNMADRERKGRNNPPRGSQQGGAKLTEDAVLEIRRSPRTARELAARFGVSYATIKDARSRRWKHVPRPAPPRDGDGQEPQA